MNKYSYKGEIITASSREEAIKKIVAMYEPDTLDSTTKNKLNYIGQVKDCIKKIWARGTRNQQEFYAKDWTARYSRVIDDCINAFEEPKVCARMMYIKYHKENPLTRKLNKNHDTDFYTLLKEARQYFEGLKKLEDDEDLDFDNLNKSKTTASAEKVFAYKGKIITASSKQEAIVRILNHEFKNSKNI